MNGVRADAVIPMQRVLGEPAIGSLWTPDGRDVCEVMAVTCSAEVEVIVVKWRRKRCGRNGVFHSLREFHDYLAGWTEHPDLFKGDQ